MLVAVDAYRKSDERSEPADVEAEAIVELVARAQRVRMSVLVPGIVFSVLGGVLLALAVREAQFALLNAHFPYATALVVAPIVAFAMQRASRLADATVRLRAPAWRAELATRHGLDRESLEELTKLL